MQRIREFLTVVLVAALPFHALLVTFGTKLALGPDNAPLATLALWKEALLGIILLIAFIEWARKPSFKLGAVDLLIGALLLLSVVVTMFTHQDIGLYALGFKYDFVPLLAFVALRRMEWSEKFLARTFKVLLCAAAAVSVYAILSLYLEQSWFRWLGYSDLHSLYTPDGPLAAYQQIEGVPIRRAQSTFSGPNQMGLWLLTPLSIALLQAQPMVGIFTLVALFLSMSRAAVLSTFVIVSFVVWKKCSKQQLIKLVASTLVLGALGGIAIMQFVPEVVSRATSSSGHIERPLEAIDIMLKNPLGLGLGMAGPASNRVSDTCVHLPTGANASWAADRPALCVFVGEEQVQPEAPCTCPLLPENWYLQIGVELGVLGFVLYVTLVALVLLRARKYPEVFLPLLGISIASLVLHAWEDTATTYTIWLLLAVALKPRLSRE